MQELLLQDEATDLFTQSDSRNPFVRPMNLYVRRKLRRNLKLMTNLKPHFARKNAMAALNGIDPNLRIDPERGFVAIPPGFIAQIDKVAAMAREIWNENRAKLETEPGYFIKLDALLGRERLRFASEVLLQPELVKLAADYLGQIPILKDMNIWWTRPIPERIGAQNFHIDSIPDTRSLRYLISLTDVDEDCGPVHVIPADETERIVKKLGYLGGAISPRFLEQECAPGSIEKMTGPVGTGVAIDTGRCFHFGSRAMQRDRLVLSISLSTYLLDEEIHNQLDWVEDPTDLTEYERMMLSP